jgi:hypothetical protein
VKRKSIVKWLVFLFAIQVAPLLSQSSNESERAGFKLTLSYHYDHSTFQKNIISLVVTMTNTSKQTIRFIPCTSYGGPYKVLVVYNGVAIEEPEQSRKEREAMERRDADGGACEGHDTSKQIAPGESEEGSGFLWRAEKDGTYQFTVEEKTFPGDPERGVTVRSNTVTVIVPEPDSEKPQ